MSSAEQVQAHLLQNALKNLSDALPEAEAAKGNIDGASLFTPAGRIWRAAGPGLPR